jgi:hypothetical protein
MAFLAHQLAAAVSRALGHSSTNSTLGFLARVRFYGIRWLEEFATPSSLYMNPGSQSWIISLPPPYATHIYIL